MRIYGLFETMAPAAKLLVQVRVLPQRLQPPLVMLSGGTAARADFASVITATVRSFEI